MGVWRQRLVPVCVMWGVFLGVPWPLVWLFLNWIVLFLYVFWMSVPAGICFTDVFPSLGVALSSLRLCF